MTDENTEASLEHDAKAPITREALYDLVWSEPMLKVAARFSVSSSYMARVCTMLNVPRPDRGYWSKLAVGKASQKPSLPEASPGDLLAWSRDATQVYAPRPSAPQRLPRVKAKPKTVTDLPKQHPLIVGAKTHFESGRKSRDTGYFRPYKRLLVDLLATEGSLARALDFANQLFLAFEAEGHRVTLSSEGDSLVREAVDEREVPNKNRYHEHPWSPQRNTVVYIGTVAFGLTIFEISEYVKVRYVKGEYVRESEYVPTVRGRYSVDHTWTTDKDLPSGRLCLQAYSPYHRADWVHQWKETNERDLLSRIPAIVRYLKQQIPELLRLVEEGERQAQIEHERWQEQMAKWERERELARQAKALKDSKEELASIIETWARSKRLEAFFADAEEKVANLDELSREKMLGRLQLARQLIGSTDALERFALWKTPGER